MSKAYQTSVATSAIVALYAMSVMVFFATVGTTGPSTAQRAVQTPQAGARSALPAVGPALPQKAQPVSSIAGRVVRVDPKSKTLLNGAQPGDRSPRPALTRTRQRL